MQIYTKMVYIVHTHGRLLHFLFWVRKFSGFQTTKTSADKRRLITIYVQRLLVQGVIVAVVTPTIPNVRLCGCKVTMIFTNTQILCSVPSYRASLHGLQLVLHLQ